jgi:glycosyltransferase A (GT-A) superfamily protein (DUF2064 family)
LSEPAKPRVLLVVRTRVRPALEPLLGAERCSVLERALIKRAATWGERVAPGEVHVAYEPAGSELELRELLGEDVTLLALDGEGTSARLAHAAARLFAVAPGPVLITWPDLPRWRPEHALGALDDLSDGCDVSFGPVFDGGFYLIAVGRPVPALLGLPEEAWSGPDAMGVAIGAANEAGLGVGLLRPERGLHRPEDVRAVLADPLMDPELVAILGAPSRCRA